MDTCSTSFPKRKGHISKILPQNKHVTKRKRKQMWNGGGLQMQKVGMVGESKRRSWGMGHGAWS